MEQPTEPEGLTTDAQTHSTARDDMAYAEPYWMQDVRLAQRAIDAERARLRAARSRGSSE